MTARTSAELRKRVLYLGEEDLTQAEIAERTGLERSTVSRIEHESGKGRRKRRRSFADEATGVSKRQDTFDGTDIAPGDDSDIEFFPEDLDD